MRATTFDTPNVSRATRAARMFELSPLLTAANAYASWIPASSRVSRSKPRPTTRRPSKPAPSRRNASGLWSTTATVWPRASTSWARVEPVRPHPMITKCTRSGSSTGAGSSRGDAPTVHGGRWRAARRGWAPLGGAPAGRRPRAAYHANVLPLTDAVKRLLVGRPVHSERLAETLLPKRIALPVFASDALSSVAYAPDEVFLTLAFAGVAAYAASPWIGLAVVFVMLI